MQNVSRARAGSEKKNARSASPKNRGAGGRLAQAAGGILRLRGDLLAAGILASLRRWNAHGYRLGRELVKAGLPMLDSATLYRTLRELERAGLVSSFWDTSSSGPARRMYSLTKTGDVFLSNWMETMQRFQAVFQRAALEANEEIETTSSGQGKEKAVARRSAPRAIGTGRKAGKASSIPARRRTGTGRMAG